ncbi:MAG: phosphoribosyltransferase family protein [Rhodoglobus sp.]
MLRDHLRDAWSVLFPVECSGCGAEDRSVCPRCRAALEPEVTLRFAGGLRVHTALLYEGRVRRVILAFKEQGRTDAAAALARPLATAIAAATVAAPAAELLCVPTSRAAYRKRGYDPVALLLRRAGLSASRELVHVRTASVQKALGVDERSENLRGALASRHRLDGRSFVVIDDILTSGATLTEAARAVRAAGGEVVAAATVAFTVRLLPFRDIASGQEYVG